MAFDTLTAARDLEAAGMARKQAEAVASAIRAGQGELATRADLRADLAGLETRLTTRMYGLALAVAAVVVASNGAVVFGLLRLLLP